MAVEYVIDVTVNSKKYPSLEAGFRGVKAKLNSRSISDAFKKQLRGFLNEIATDMERQHSGGYPSGTTSKTLSSRTGEGVSSIRRSIVVKGSNISNIFGTIGGLKRLAIHEFGGTIRARGGHLAIPLPDALNSRGLPKRQSPRDWGKTKILRSRRGNLVIYREIGASRKELLYVLVGPKSNLKEISFKENISSSLRGSGIAPARLGMRKAVEKRIGDIGDRIAVAVTAELNRELAGA